ncbi:recombinase family protein [Streptomyces yunnanensis]|uniref:Site-specific DNA recombinase n=1 Tax=Streptomyces yunnanensis TaxID=156453 RepID=A0A9X8QY61_9ACTN|nr:recombinase family protein [Streptomyces yunnanensis]SHM99758.1 Site-specific DNA recombinase [Streptomyces yunnanensis]
MSTIALTDILGVGRLSRDKEESTSPERQRSVVDGIGDMLEGQITGWAFDSGVSGRVAPFEREELGPWLSALSPECAKRQCHHTPDTPCMGQWSVMAAWKMDRVTRSALHFHQLMEWCREHGRAIVTADGVNTTTKAGRQTAELMAMVASWEWEAIQERSKNGYDAVVRAGRHRGGFVPYGYRPTRIEGKEGWYLEPCPEAAPVVGEIVRRIIEGESINAVVVWLNESKTPTSLDVQRIRAGKEPKGCLWRVGNLAKLLRSESLLGFMVTDAGEKIMGTDGRPVRRADRLISDGQWSSLQAALDARQTNKGKTARRDSAQLIRVAYCGMCDRPMYVNKGRTWTYYRCSSKTVGGVHCGNGSVPTHLLEEMVEGHFLHHVGDLEWLRAKYVPGRDHSKEIEELRGAVDRLTASLAKLNPGPALDRVVTSLNAHNERLTEIEAEPVIPAQVIEEPTGETFREVWERLNAKGRGDFLRDCRVQVMWGSPAEEFDGKRFPAQKATAKSPIFHVHFPEDIEKRAQAWARSREQSPLEQAA